MPPCLSVCHAHALSMLSILCGRLTCSAVDESVNGEALAEMQNQDFKEMGITSIGHRLTLLKAVYEVKVKQNIPLDNEHYVPLCTSIVINPLLRLLQPVLTCE